MFSTTIMQKLAFNGSLISYCTPLVEEAQMAEFECKKKKCCKKYKRKGTACKKCPKF